MVRLIALLSVGVTAGCFVDSRSNGDGEDTETAGSTSGASVLVTSISISATLGTTSTSAGPTTASETATATETESGSATTTVDVTGTGTGTGTGTAGDTTTETDSSGGTADSTTDGGSSSTGDDVLTVDMLEVGDLVITEVMVDPFCNLDPCEWIELLNRTESTINLNGLGIGDRDALGGAPTISGMIQIDALLEPGAAGVLRKSAMNWPYSFAVLATYGSDLQLNNGAPEIVYIFNDLAEILDETATFITETSNQGRSYAVRPGFETVLENDDSDNWCLSDDPLDAGGSDEWGTPNALGVNCFVPPA